MPSLSLQRSKKRLEDDGWKVWKVEVWNQWAGKRIDLYNLMDLVAIKATVQGVLGVQCCGEDVQEHIKKYLEGYKTKTGIFIPPNEYLTTWKASGNRLLIHSWVKRGLRGKRKLWTLREVEL